MTTTDQIIQAVCTRWEVTPKDLCRQSRKMRWCYPRQVAMHLMRIACPHLSYQDIAATFCLSDHTSARHADRKIGAAREVDGTLDRWCRRLVNGLQPDGDPDREGFPIPCPDDEPHCGYHGPDCDEGCECRWGEETV